MAEKLLEKVTVYYSIQNGGDGSAYPAWFLTDAEAEHDQDAMSEGWGEPCSGSVETYVGSDIHCQAVEVSRVNQLKEECEGKDLVTVLAHLSSLGLKHHVRKDQNGYSKVKLPRYIKGLVFLYHDGSVVQEIDIW